MQTHTPAVEQGEGGWKPPTFFVTLRYFEKILPLIDSVFCPLQDDINIMGYICKCTDVQYAGFRGR